MRDPERIERVLALIRKYWHQNPDMRLTQIIVNHIHPPTLAPDVFHYEDDKLEAKLRESLKGK